MDLNEILCSEFHFTYPLTVVRESATKKFYLSLTETTDVIREALRYQQGAKSSYPASHSSVTVLAPRTLPKPVAAPKPGNMAELILTCVL